MHQESRLITSCISLLEGGMRLLERLDDEVYAKTSVLYRLQLERTPFVS
jgi:hypothetical protein